MCEYAAMLFSFVYLAVNILALIAVLANRYYRLWPFFCLAQVLVCWQIGMGIYVPLEDRAMNIGLWLPGEFLLVIALCLGVGEAVWKSLNEIDRRWRQATFWGLATACASFAYFFRRVVSTDWYRQVLADRSIVFLALAFFAFSAVWVGLFYHRHWPRAARMQIGLYAVLMCSHVVLVDWSHWAGSNRQFRWLEMICCAGFVINSNFLKGELLAVRESPCETRENLPDRHSLPRLA